MALPKISIITINYNEPLLERTCESVVNQTFKDYEWIVIDGDSTNPQTLETLRRYKENMAYFVSEPDDGVFDAMNKGIEQASGYWLIFMNAGDCFYNNESLKSMVPYIDQNKNCAVVYGGILREHKEKLEPYFIKQKRLDDLFFLVDTIMHQSSFIRRDMFVKYGKYRDEFRVVSDWAKFAQMYWAGEKFKSVDFIVSKYNLNGISSTISRDDIFMEYVKIWIEYQPWVFEIDRRLLKAYKYFYSILYNLFFTGELHRYFTIRKNTYKTLLKYTEMCPERLIK